MKSFLIGAAVFTGFVAAIALLFHFGYPGYGLMLLGLGVMTLLRALNTHDKNPRPDFYIPPHRRF